ncbi:hypothetical protein ACH5RR_030074 [Cinchona calisaya]|uniref:Uncharacterized protein n=1 Tax=Cinchona calisaya TaxID=153742 RepID=A0ABD2YTN0_9GENT
MAIGMRKIVDIMILKSVDVTIERDVQQITNSNLNKAENQDLVTIELATIPEKLNLNSNAMDELALFSGKSSIELLAYFLELDCPNDSNEQTIQEWRKFSQILANKLNKLDSSFPQ